MEVSQKWGRPFGHPNSFRGLDMGIRLTIGLFKDNGKENGNYHIITGYIKDSIGMILKNS